MLQEELKLGKPDHLRLVQMAIMMIHGGEFHHYHSFGDIICPHCQFQVVSLDGKFHLGSRVCSWRSMIWASFSTPVSFINGSYKG